MAATQTRIAEHIEGFYGAADRTSEGAIASHAYKQSVAELDTIIGRELVSRATIMNTGILVKVLFRKDTPYRTTISEPIGKMNAYFPIINEQISKRNKKVCQIL